jgi:hypothetical protein
MVDDAMTTSCNDCVICLDEISEDTKSELECTHTFHTACITHWMKVARQKDCPICKRPSALFGNPSISYDGHGTFVVHITHRESPPACLPCNVVFVTPIIVFGIVLLFIYVEFMTM